MKFALAALLLATSAFAQQPLRMAAACGPTDAKFDVKLDNTRPAAPELEPGKLLFISFRMMGLPLTTSSTR
ncbi:MAG TPA: hypothetical protein VIJ65_04025 [Acidobacteriaceae bacterium]